jgi:hypothetical protein
MAPGRDARAAVWPEANPVIRVIAPWGTDGIMMKWRSRSRNRIDR